MKRPANGSTPRQYAYANKLLNGDGLSKKDIARSVGFSPSLARNPKQKIESTEGFHNAIIELATKSNNILVAALHEYEARGFKKFTPGELATAVSTIMSVWEKFDKKLNPPEKEGGGTNKLRSIVLQRIENQTMNASPAKVVSKVEPIEVAAEEVLDL
jgi:hypothetical protein